MALSRIIIAFTLIGLLSFSAQRATAHANLVRSEPSANAFLTQAPSEIRLWFSEPVQPQFSRILLRDSSGARVALSDAAVDAYDANQLVLLTGDLADGLYTVSWRVVSATDGHPTEGSFSFGINVVVTSPAAQTEEETVPFAAVVVNIVNLLAASVTVGGLAFALFVGRGMDNKARLGRLLQLGWTGWGAALLCLLLWQTARNSGVGLFDASFGTTLIATVTATHFGATWLLRLAFWLALGLCLWWRSKHIVFGWLALASGVAILVAHSLFGHASGVQDSGIAIAANALHLLLTALWIGGLIAFFVALVPLPHALDAPRNTAVFVCMFSNYMRVAVAGLIITGMYAAWLHVGSLAALVGTLYGRALLVKLMLILPLLVIAAINLVWTARRLNAGDFRWVGRLRGLVGAEVALLTAVLVAAAVLTSGNPARATEALRAANRAQPVTAPYAAMEHAGDLMIRLEITPGTVGANEFVVALLDHTGAAITDASLIRMRLENRDQDIGQSEIRPQLAEDGLYRITAANLSLPGEWRIRLNIQRPSQFDVVTDFEIDVSPPSPPADSPEMHAIPFMERIAAAGLMGVSLVTISGYMLAQERRQKRTGGLVTIVASFAVGILIIVYAGGLLVNGGVFIGR